MKPALKGSSIKDKTNWSLDEAQNDAQLTPILNKSSFDSLMDNILILDRSIYEYKFIFAKNLMGGSRV